MYGTGIARRIGQGGIVKFRFWAPGRVVSWAEIVGVSKRRSSPDFSLRLFNLTRPVRCILSGMRIWQEGG
jgi:hypothetical protein